MKLRLALLAAVLYFVPRAAFATNIEINQVAENRSVAAAAPTPASEPEEITHRKTLAVHLGLSAEEVVFGKPRNFRSESLNNFGLDPITDEEQ